MEIQWYPHHMAKAKEKLQDQLELIDVVLEVLDARIPVSSHNDDLNKLVADKQRIVILNKIDLADPGATDQWLHYFRQSKPAIAVNSLTGHGVEKILSRVKELMVDREKELAAKGIQHKDIRLLVVGVPNVGKSQLINQLGSRNKTRTGDKAGVTRSQQWVTLQSGFKLLDTPGVLWPKCEKEAGIKLGMCGAIKEGNFDPELLAYRLVEVLTNLAPGKLKSRFKLNHLELPTYDLIAQMGRKRGCLQSGGRVNRERISRLIIREFRTGKLGRITLEQPPKEF